MAFWLTAGISGTPYASSNYTANTYFIRLNWDNSNSFYGYSSSAGCFIRYNIGAGNVDVPISISAPSAAGGSGSGYTTLASGTLNISHNSQGIMNSCTIYGSYSNGYVGNLTASDYVGNLQDFDVRPSAPDSCSAVVNADKTITVTSGTVSSPYSTPTYYVQYNKNGTGWTNQKTMSSRTYTYTVSDGIVPGATYEFRTWASNADGSGSFTYSGSYFVTSGGKRYNGSSWVNADTAKRFDGSSWVQITTAKRYNGSSWADLA
jgi:hypothetical protein